MLYWDTSALFTAITTDPQNVKVKAFLSKVGPLESYSSIITPIEMESAIQRRLNNGSLGVDEAKQARKSSAEFRKATLLIPMDSMLLDIALHLQRIHSLRPGDAIQLASARLGTTDPKLVHFLCLDQVLNEAALEEGFQVPLKL